jgi:hypothetical protein
MDEVYSVILVGDEWQVYRGDAAEPEEVFSSEQDAVEWCSADAIGEPRIRVYQGDVCGP